MTTVDWGLVGQFGLAGIAIVAFIMVCAGDKPILMFGGSHRARIADKDQHYTEMLTEKDKQITRAYAEVAEERRQRYEWQRLAVATTSLAEKAVFSTERRGDSG